MALLRTTVPTAVLLLAAALILASCCSWAGGCEGDDDGAGCFLRYSLIGCAPPTPAPTGTQAAEADDATAFRAALAALPSAAAATGFASLRSVGRAAGTDRAHAFGLCFGEPDGCLTCLSAAAAAVTEGCGNHTRRGGCLLAYAAAADGSEGRAFEFLAGGDTRDQALAEAKGRPSIWTKALSFLFYALAAVGAIAIVLLLCAFIAICMLARTLVGLGHSAPIDLV